VCREPSLSSTLFVLFRGGSQGTIPSRYRICTTVACGLSFPAGNVVYRPTGRQRETTISSATTGKHTSGCSVAIPAELTMVHTREIYSERYVSVASFGISLVIVCNKLK